MDKSSVNISETPREKQALEIHGNIIGLKQVTEANYLGLAEYLYTMFQEALYQELGFDHFSDYLKSPEVSIEYRSANRLIETYRVFVLKYNIDKPLLLSAGYSKLYLIHNQVNEENINEWVDKAVSCTRKDLEAEVNDKGDQSLEVPEYFNWESFAGRTMELLGRVDFKEPMFPSDYEISYQELKNDFDKAKKVKRL